MNHVYVKEIIIDGIRGLRDIQIGVGKDEMQHFILTGKNGSGKTSTLDALSKYINALATNKELIRYSESVTLWKLKEEKRKQSDDSENSIYEAQQNREFYEEKIKEIKEGIELEFNCPKDDLYALFEQGKYVIAYYKADRSFKAEVPKFVEKVVLKDNYGIADTPRYEFVKYLVNLKMTEALANNDKKSEKANAIREWFDKFENLLVRIFEDDSLKLLFDVDDFTFSISVEGKEPFDFNTLSSGYGAVLDIVVDIILRMENKTNKKFLFEVPGIVLIDEIETHLHIDLQKDILGILTGIFPNLQFIITTHSPFILNSLSNVVIYDLEKRLLIEEGLIDVSYEGVVKGYFEVDEMSNEIMDKFEQYRRLVQKNELSDMEVAELDRLEMVLDDMPSYVSADISTEFQRLKLEFMQREDF